LDTPSAVDDFGTRGITVAFASSDSTHNLTTVEEKTVKAPYPLQLTLLAGLMAGCSSIGSTHLERDPDSCGWKKTHLCGMPITLSVPHYFDVTVVEIYWEKDGNILRDTAADANGAHPPIVTRDARVKVVDKKEIFTVDFVKPGSGSLTTKVDLDPTTQYFTSINNKIVDTTIDDIAASIKSISSAINPLLKGGRAAPDGVGLTPHERVIAHTMVEVFDPNAREKIHEFLCEHLNGCNTCATRAGERPASVDVRPPAPGVLLPPPTAPGAPLPPPKALPPR
jgi:hypothetical protein